MLGVLMIMPYENNKGGMDFFLPFQEAYPNPSLFMTWLRTTCYNKLGFKPQPNSIVNMIKKKR
jgi:hypothetical protein